MESLTLNVKALSNDKKQFEKFCSSVGMNVSTAINMFIKKVLKEQKIPFEITAEDPFYSKANMEHLEKVIEKIESGKAKLKKHELIEE